MISIQDFKESTFEEKCEIVSEQSNYIAKRQLGNCKIYLYHSGEFFIEVYYSPVYKKVLMINPFSDTETLQPYTDIISLADLNL